MYKTEVPKEMEFLYTAYSVFKASGWVGSMSVTMTTTHNDTDFMSSQVTSVDFSSQDWSKDDSHYTVAVEADIDNQCHDEDLPLAPWY